VENWKKINPNDVDPSNQETNVGKMSMLPSVQEHSLIEHCENAEQKEEAPKHPARGEFSGEVRKVCLVGQEAVGKTVTIQGYCLGKVSEQYIPTVFDNYSVEVDFAGTHYKIEFWDTAGLEDYDRLRPLSYPLTDCFAVLISTFLVSNFDHWFC